MATLPDLIGEGVLRGPSRSEVKKMEIIDRFTLILSPDRDPEATKAVAEQWQQSLAEERYTAIRTESSGLSGTRFAIQQKVVATSPPLQITTA